MPLELTGRIVKFMQPQSGNGRNGTWTKQDFIIETNDQYPKTVCVTAWGDKVDELNRLQQGEDVKLSINIESREYNERWYTDIKVWKIEAGGGQQSSGNSGGGNRGGQQGGGHGNQPSYGGGDDFGPEPYTSSSSSAADDDLPF